MGYAQYAQQIPECYILFYRQAMDGIALNDVARTDKARSRNDALETYVALIVSENGVESMEAFSLGDVVEKSEPVDTLSCAEALAVLERDLSKGIVQNPLSIVEAELVLYATGNALDGIWLRPIWVFTAAEGEADFACYEPEYGILANLMGGRATRFSLPGILAGSTIDFYGHGHCHKRKNQFH